MAREVCPIIHSFPGWSRIPGMVAACRSSTSFSCAVSGVIDTQMLGLGSYVLHSIANVFTFDLTTGLRYEFCCRAGPSIGDWPPALSTRAV